MRTTERAVRRLRLRRPVIRRPSGHEPANGPALRWEAIAVAALLALVAVCYLSLRWYGFDVLEEGYFLTNARVVQHGGLPYRDFDAPYTPGIFYLYAWMMDRLGPDLLAMRTLQTAGRIVCYVALYLCGRQVMMPFFAALAPVAVLVMDSAPEFWGIHPGWYAAPAAVLAVLAVARYVRTGRAGWLFWSGVASGVSFAFKQNLAAYGLVAALWLVVVASGHLAPVAIPRPLGWAVERELRWLPPRQVRLFLRLTVRGQQALALLLFPLVPAVITRPYWSPLVLALFTLPLAALSGFAALTLMKSEKRRLKHEHAESCFSRHSSFFIRPVLLLTGFAVVSLPWLAAMLRALHWQLQYLGPVVGKVDPTGYFYGMHPPTTDHVLAVAGALVVPVMVGALCVYRLWSRRGLALVAGAIAAAALLQMAGPTTGSVAQDEPWNVIRGAHALLTWAGGLWAGYGETQHTTTDLVLYLPPIAFWASFTALCARAWRRRQVPTVGYLLELWLLAAGSALFLNQYPRMDESHWLWSSGVLLAAGAVVLQAWERHALRVAPELARAAAARTLFRWSLALLPAVALFPHVWERVDAWSGLAPAPPDVTHAASGGARQELVPLSVGGAPPVWVPREQYQDIQEVVDLLDDKTAPGEPIFTYPAIPGFYFLADRSNATRFNHLFNGMASPADQQQIVRQLQQVRYVVWDDGGAHYWVQPGVNPDVTEYIRTHFRVERYIGDYTVLARDARGPALSYLLPAPREAPNTTTASAQTTSAEG